MTGLPAILAAVGSAAVVLTGITAVSGVLTRATGGRFRALATDPDAGRPARFGAGLRAAALGASDGACAVSLVSLADGGSVPVDRAPWTLLGVNLGATLACWVVAIAGFRIGLAGVALGLMVVALPFRLGGRLGRYTPADVLTGVALLLVGLDLLSGRLVVVAEPAGFAAALARFADSAAAPFAGFAAGAVIAFLFRSSVATALVAMALAARGWLDLPTAAALILGTSLGVAGAGYSIAARLGPGARRAALVHALINGSATVVGAAAFVPALRFVRWLAPSVNSATVTAPTAVATALAFYHTLVHALNAIVDWPLVRPIVALVNTILPESDAETEVGRPAEFTVLPSSTPESLDANLVLTQSGLARMAETAYEMLMIVINASQEGEQAAEANERLVALRTTVKELEADISAALTWSVQLPCSREQAERIAQQQRIAQEVSLIGDDCFKTLRLIARSHRKGYRAHAQSADELFDFTSQILDFLRYNVDYLEGRIESPDWELANRMEDTIDKVRDKLKKRARKALEKDGKADIRGELAFIDIVAHLEHVGDRCLRISETVRKLTPRRRG